MRSRMDVLDGAVRADDAGIPFPIPAVAQETCELLLNQCAVVGVNQIEPFFERWRTLLSVATEDSILLARPVDVASGYVPPPAARMGQSLPFSQVGFAASQFFFRPLSIGDIDDRPDVLGELACFAESRMGDAVDLPDASVWAHDSISRFIIPCFANRLLKPLPHSGAIVAVNHFQEQFV